MSYPKTVVCTVCGETAYLEGDERYVCQECGNDFDLHIVDDDDMRRWEIEDDDFDEEDYE
jgi:predicted RNA-binding Zn-ribbon protein involved in translation (DUF1610 family)